MIVWGVLTVLAAGTLCVAIRVRRKRTKSRHATCAGEALLERVLQCANETKETLSEVVSPQLADEISFSGSVRPEGPRWLVSIDLRNEGPLNSMMIARRFEKKFCEFATRHENENVHVQILVKKEGRSGEPRGVGQ